MAAVQRAGNFVTGGGRPTLLPGQKKKNGGDDLDCIAVNRVVGGFSALSGLDVRFGSIAVDPGRLCTSVEDRVQVCAEGWCVVIAVAFGQSQRFDAIDHMRTDVLVG